MVRLPCLEVLDLSLLRYNSHISTCCVYPLSNSVDQIDTQRVLGYVLFMDGKKTKLPYPLEKFHAEVAGRSFHDGRFIQMMREKVVALQL